jgi:hypothetical protein
MASSQRTQRPFRPASADRGEQLLKGAGKAEAAWRKAVTLPAGSNQYTMVRDNITDHKPSQRGTSRAHTLTRLKENSPGLYEAVCRTTRPASELRRGKLRILILK